MIPPESPRFIYWREEDQSFLPSLDEAKLADIINAGLHRYIHGVRLGTIQPLQKVIQQQFEGLEPAISDWDSMQCLSNEIRNAYGNWVPSYFCYHALHNTVLNEAVAKPRGCVSSLIFGHKRQKLNIDSSTLETARNTLVNALKVRHGEINELLFRLHDLSPSSTPERPTTQPIISAMAKLIENELEPYEADDRWFGWLPEKASIYLESVNCYVPIEQIDEIADKHFQSWVEPETDTILKFADEIAAISVVSSFWEKYRTNGNAQP